MDSHRDFQLRRQSLVLNKDKHLKIVYTTSVGICQSVKSARFMMYWQMNDWHFMNTLLKYTLKLLGVENLFTCLLLKQIQ